jgi:hypothetical protein
VVQEDGCYITTAVLYGVLSLIALVQLVRIQLRVPEYGWTTQKVFHLLNFLCSGCTTLSRRPSAPAAAFPRRSCSLRTRGQPSDDAAGREGSQPARCAVMSFRRPLDAVHPHILTFVALDLPGLLFFSTYSLLVLFWAEIYHQVSVAFRSKYARNSQRCV